MKSRYITALAIPLCFSVAALANPNDDIIETTSASLPGNDPIVEQLELDEPRRPERLSGSVNTRPIAMVFTGFDRNGDRVIDKGELDQGIAAEWDSMDKTLSDKVSPIAFAGWQESALGSRDALPSRVSFDIDLDTMISEREFSATLSNIFATMDKDGDAVLTRAEMTFLVPRRGQSADDVRKDAEQRRRERREQDRQQPRRIDRF